MARRQAARMPVNGGIRRRRTTPPSMTSSIDRQVLRYNAIGSTVVTNTSGVDSDSVTHVGAGYRFYIPGNVSNGIGFSPGPAIASYYSTGVFRPGTLIRWEPSVSFTSTGRVFVGFTDNPEMMRNLFIAWYDFVNTGGKAKYLAYSNLVKSLGDLRSFPIWQETEVPFPLRPLRRPRFDTNTGIDTSLPTEDYSRSCQTGMFYVVEGCDVDAPVGSWWFRDVLDVEGMTNVPT